ncbi:MAG: hypothetical protein UF218_07230, partial [Eggerthellaceae bacterium]|nr:hypothetical protein [Eggerthellaceae bacterium]
MPDKEEMMTKMQKMTEDTYSDLSLVGDAKYWSEIKLSSDILTDAVAKHVLGLVYTGMADVGETLQCICDIDKFVDDGCNDICGKVAKSDSKGFQSTFC